MLIMAGILVVTASGYDRMPEGVTTPTAYGNMDGLELVHDPVHGGLLMETYQSDLGLRLRIGIPDDISSEYDRYSWKVVSEYGQVYATGPQISCDQEYECPVCRHGTDLTEIAGHRLTTATPYLDWKVYRAGSYRIEVVCGSGWSPDELRIRDGFRFEGGLVNDCAWSYKGTGYELRIAYDLEDFERYHDADVIRDASGEAGVGHLVDFVTTDRTVSAIADDLVSLYKGRYGSDARVDGQDFADFVLAFVQCCFKYPLTCSNGDCPLSSGDRTLYGRSDYFAYPLETLYLGMGDCEDQSLLTASILKACGYDTALLPLPGHIVVAVALDDYVETGRDSPREEQVCGMVDGRMYYAGSPVVNHPMPFGIIRYNCEPYAPLIGHGIYDYILV